MRRRAGPILPLAATLVVLALAILAASRLTIDHDITRLLPDSDARLGQSARALRSFLEHTIVDVGSEDGSHSVELLGEIADRLIEDLEASGTVLRARADLALEDALEFVDFIRAHTPLLLSESAWTEIEAGLRPDVVNATLETLERRIQEPDGAYLAGQAPLDPLGFGNLALAPLVALAAGPPGAKLVDGRILSADGKHLLVLIEPGVPASDLAHTTRFLEALEESETHLAKVPAYRGVRLREMGAHRASKDNELQIRRDVMVTSLAASVLVALLIFLCFGRLRLALLCLTPALVGGVVALGLFSLFKGSVAAPALGFGAVLIGLTDDFAVHVLATLTKGRERAEIPARALLLGAFVTSLACALLCGSSLPGIRDIGLLGSIGILVAALYALWVLPSLKPFLGAPKRPLVDLERLLQYAPVPRRAAGIALLATPLLALGAPRIGFDDEIRNLSSLSPDARADEEVMRSTWGDSQTSSLVIEAPSVQAALEANDELARWLEVAQREGRLVGYASIAGMVPALATQEERWLRWQSFWTPQRREELDANLRAAAARTRFRADAFAPFLRSLEAAPSWIEPAHFDQGDQDSSAQWVADRLVRDGENWRVLTPIFTSDGDQLAHLAERMRVEQPGVVLANSEALMRQIAGLVSREMVVFGILSFLVVATVVFGWLAESLLTLVVLSPLVLGLLWTLGILGWLGLKLDLINAVFVVFQFGVAVDYSIFIAASYVERMRTGVERSAEARGAALLCALTTCAGFGAMGLAGHPVLFTIGVTAFVGIASAATAAQLFVPVICEALLVAQGPNGAPAPRNVCATVWVAVRILLYRLRVSVFGTSAGAALGGLASDIRRRLPIGRRVFDGALQPGAERPRILVANHESDYDAIGVLALVPNTDVPVPAALRRLAGAGSATDASALGPRARAALRRGRSVLVFPGGDRPETRWQAFQSEAFALARELEVPVQPVALVNTREFRQIGGWIGDHDLRVSLLAPIDPAEDPGTDGDQNLARRAEQCIRERCAELWLDTFHGPQWHRPVAGIYRHHGPFLKNYAASKARRDPLVFALPGLCSGTGAVLIVGCGYGIMTARLASAYPEREIVALDPDGRKLDAARNALGNRFAVRFLREDIRAHVSSSSYEWVCLVDVLHYWDEAAQREILACLRARMSASSRLLFRDGCAGPGTRNWIVRGAESLALLSGFTRASGKLNFHSEEVWRRLLGECGFSVESAHPELGLFSNLVLICSRTAHP